jgi:hypothetical protein
MSVAATLLHQASAILARAAHPQEALSEIANLTGQIGHLDQVRISIQNPLRGTSVSAAFESANQQPAGVALNREFRAGHQTYGHIEILAAKPAIRAVELFQFVNTLEALLLNYAVLEARRSEQIRLRSTLHLLEEEVRVSKVTARAQSLLAPYGFSPQAAIDWLEQESRRARVSITIAAERFIAQHRRRQSEAA